MIGRTFNNRYKLTERVGLGGMAEVYRAEDNVLGRTVAVKVMLPQYAADPTFTKRFRQEAASAANLQSPYIVSIYDWGLDGETYYIVMEFLRGTDLKTAIKERGAINQRKAAEIGSQVAQALSVAHAGGIIHRDIKPQNIMIQPDGNIKVMDFGIARAGDAGLSQTATVLGTAHYVSPEQAQGKELTGASDIYSLGVVLYEATTGKLPFDGQDAVSVAVKQVNELPAPPSTINPNIDPALEAIIMKAIEKDPERRFKDASEMRHILNDYLAGRPINLGDDISGLKTQVMGGVAPVNGTAVMNPVGGANGDAGRTTVNKAYAADANDEGKKKSKRNVVIGVVVALLAVIGIVAAAMALGGNQEMVNVPDVSNKPIAEARSELQAAGFTIGTETEVYNPDVEAGNVVSTDPAAGVQAAKGSSVNITISKGTEQVTVPDLRGMSADDAQRVLASYGLNGQQGDTVFSDDVEENRVAQQDIAAGTTAYKGDTITFHLSKGPETASVPNVQGLDFETARDRLEAAGFTVSLQWRDDSAAVNTVIRQSVTGTAKLGTTITLTISNGPAEEDETNTGNTGNNNGGTSGDNTGGSTGGSESGGSGSNTGGSTSGTSQ